MNDVKYLRKGCVIISGGTRGLGLELVKFCLDNGWPVVTFARKSTKEIEFLLEKFRSNLFFKTLDITNYDEVKKLVKEATERYKIIYGLVNNAAIGQDNLLTHTSDDVIHNIISINLEAQIILTKYVIRQMILNGNGGRILFISSIAGIRGYSGLTVYSASKGALNSFVRSLAHEVGERGILVNAIAPGFFSSEMSMVLTSEQMEIIRRRTPTQKLITPSDIIPLFDLLMFKEINITGQIFCIDGGASI
jgi:3-oxoacyl-[acyl-carrier protein] reductase